MMVPKLVLLTPDNFNLIFDHIVKEVRKDLGTSAEGFCRLLENRKTLLFRAYDDARSNVRFRYMQNPDGHLDRHKCGAAFMSAFLNVFKDKDDGRLNLEHMAITMGLLILKLFINTRNKKYCDTRMANFINQNGFEYPDSICDEGIYKDNWALGIYYDRKEDCLSPLSLSNALFLIESYNRELAGVGKKTSARTTPTSLNTAS
jgi:hypothetical protein